MLTHFAELFVQYCRSYLLALNILFILLLLRVLERDFRLTYMFLKLYFSHSSNSQMEVLFCLTSYFSILTIDLEEIPLTFLFVDLD